LKKVLGIPTPYPFENMTLTGVENPDAYLSTMYGNYMSIPPEEKRTSHTKLILLK